MKLKHNDYLTSKEAAAIIGVSHDHIRRLIRDGKIKAEKLGHNWLIQRVVAKKIKRQRFPRKKEKKNGSSERIGEKCG